MVKVKINVQHFDSQGWAVATAQTDPDKRQQSAPCWSLFCVFKLNILNIFREQSSQHSTEECQSSTSWSHGAMTRHRGPDSFFTRPGQRKVNFREAKEWAGNWPRVDPVVRIINCESLIPQCSESLVSIIAQWPIRWEYGEHWPIKGQQLSIAHWCSGPGQSVILTSHCIQNPTVSFSGSMSERKKTQISYLSQCRPTRRCGHWIRDTCHAPRDTCPPATCRCPHCPTCPLCSSCRPDCNWQPRHPLHSSGASHLFRSQSPRHPKIMGGVKI